MYILLDARERAKARPLLDPSTPSDAKAFSPPISNSDIRSPPFDRSLQPFDFRTRILDFDP